MSTKPQQENRPYIIQFAGTRFAFPELRFAIKRAAAITLGTIADKPAFKRVAVFYRDTCDEETRLGVVIEGEWFPVTKPATFEDLERAIIERSFAFQLLASASTRLGATARRIYANGARQGELAALDDAETIIHEAIERVTAEMSHTEQAANFKLERLTEK